MYTDDYIVVITAMLSLSFYLEANDAKDAKTKLEEKILTNVNYKRGLNPYKEYNIDKFGKLEVKDIIEREYTLRANKQKNGTYYAYCWEDLTLGYDNIIAINKEEAINKTIEIMRKSVETTDVDIHSISFEIFNVLVVKNNHIIYNGDLSDMKNIDITVVVDNENTLEQQTNGSNIGKSIVENASNYMKNYAVEINMRLNIYCNDIQAKDNSQAKTFVSEKIAENLILKDGYQGYRITEDDNLELRVNSYNANVFARKTTNGTYNSSYSIVAKVGYCNIQAVSPTEAVKSAIQLAKENITFTDTNGINGARFDLENIIIAQNDIIIFNDDVGKIQGIRSSEDIITEDVA